MEMLWYTRCKLLVCICGFLCGFAYLILSLEPYLPWGVFGGVFGIFLSVSALFWDAELRYAYIYWCVRSDKKVDYEESSPLIEKPSNSHRTVPIPSEYSDLEEARRSTNHAVSQGAVHSSRQVNFTFVSDGRPVAGATVMAVFPDSVKEGVTDNQGRVAIHSDKPIPCLLAAHPNLPPIHINQSLQGTCSINWFVAKNAGSVICRDFCQLPGLSGSLGVEHKFNRNFVKCGADGILRFLDFKSNLLTSSLMIDTGSYFTVFDTSLNLGIHVNVLFLQGTLGVLEYSKTPFTKDSSGQQFMSLTPNTKYPAYSVSCHN